MHACPPDRTIAPAVKPVALAVALALAASGAALAAPVLNGVAYGAASVTTPSSGTTRVTQSTDKAILNWTSFSIGTGETVQFQQPAASSIALNRVIGTDPSSILGNLTANGKVFLVNQNGILFGAQARVDVGSLVASTLDIADSDFVAGRYRFAGNSTAAVQALASESGSQRATLNAADGGTIALLGATVTNNGTITARMGTVGLASGGAVTLDFAGDGLTQLTVDPASINALVQNGGAVIADGGQIILRTSAISSLASSVVNQTGTLQANAVALSERNGKLVLDAGGDGMINAGGTMTATGLAAGQRGGAVSLLGHDINLTGSIDASGSAGGGTVTADGTAASDGDSPSVITLNNRASVLATATDLGAGGTISLKNTGVINLYGTANVKAGARGGDGGRVQTNGSSLNVAGFLAIATSNGGARGVWSMDASNINIDTNLASSIGHTLDMNTDVVVNTHVPGPLAASSDIVVAAPVTTTGTAALTLNAARDIVVNPNVGMGALGQGRLDVGLDSGAQGGAGAIAMLAGASITTNGGAIAMYGNRDPVNGAASGTAAYPNGVLLDGASLSTSSSSLPGGAVTIRGTGTRGSVAGRVDGYTGPVAGVVLENATVDARLGNVTLAGTSYVADGVGVAMSNVGIMDASQVGLTGLALEQAATGVQLEGTTIAPTYFNPVDMHVTILGRGTTGTGVALNDFHFNSFYYSNTGNLVIGGESAASAPGVSFSGSRVTANAATISALNNQSVGSGSRPMLTTDAANLSVIDANMVNFRPGGVDVNGALTTALDVPIAFGSSLYPFHVTLSDFGLAGGGDTYYSPLVVIGSAAHRGVISVGASGDVLYGDLTLQNGGAGSQGITFTAPLNVAGQLALSSGGPVTSTAFALTANSLLLHGTQPAASFTLTNPANQFDTLAATYDASTAAVQGGIDVVNAGALVMGPLSGVGYAGAFTTIDAANTVVGGNVTVQTSGALALQQNITSTMAGITLATGTVLDNSAGASLTPNANDGWHVFASTWAGEERGALAPAAVHPNYYNCTYGTGCEAAFAPLRDSHFIYGAQPTLTVTADSAARTYGDANPAFTYTYSGLVNGDSVADARAGSLTTSAVPASDVGTYAITGAFTSPVGYAINVTPGTLTVNQTPLLVTANDQSKVYGAADPFLTATYTGLKLGQTALEGVRLATVTGAAATAGTHAITVTGSTAANYDVTYQPGVLSVAPAVLTYSATPAVVTAGATGASLTGSVTGFVYGESVASATSGAAAFDTSAARPFAAGTYAVLGSGLTAANYRFVQAPGNQTALSVLAGTVVPPTSPVQPVQPDPLVVLASLAIIPEADRDLNFTSSALYDKNVNGTRVCVGAGAYAAGSSAGDVNDSLSLEWSRVRISPNLSNCFSLGERNSCSDF